MIELYNKLSSTNSTNDKIAIISKYKNDDKVKNTLRLCYDPFIHSYLNKIPKPSKIGFSSFNDLYDRFCNLYDDLNSRKITGNFARDIVKEFLECADKESQDLFIKILKKDLKVKIGIKIINKAFGYNYIDEFEVQLGYPYDPNRKYLVSKNHEVHFWYCSRKLNGIRGFLEGNDCLRTRNGNKIYGFDHIIEEIKHLKSKYNLSFVDGELFSIGIPFQTITSYVLSDVNINPEHKKLIKFNVFAIGRRWKNTGEMIDFFEQIDWSVYKFIVPLKYERINNFSKAIYNKMNEYYEEGFEGAMLRHPVRYWERGRSHDIVKVKPELDEKFEIIGFEKGKDGGENENTLGAIVIQGIYKISKKDKKTGREIITEYPIRCNCGSGFKKNKVNNYDITRNDIWNNQSEWLGRWIDVAFQAITDKPDKDGFYALQFPRFVQPKDDQLY